MNNNLLDKEALNLILTNRGVRQQVTYQSHLLFFHVFFSHYVKYPIAEFQKEIFRITEDASNTLACIVSFRGSSKSTLVTFSYSLWAVLGVQQKKFVLIVCQTQSQARQHMANLKHELEQNETLKSDLGPFREDIGVGEWAMSSLVFKNTGARIMVASMDQSIRGARHRQYRPDLIILDDIEDVNSVKTHEGRSRVSDWFSREIVPLGDIGTRIVIVGNLLHEDSFVMQLKRKIERKELSGVYRSFPLIDSDGGCLWPGKFDCEEKIEQLRQSVANESAWLMEYLLLPVSDASRVIHPEWIAFYDEMPERCEENEYRGASVGIDLAISERDRADCTAMVTAHVFGYGKDMRIYIEPNPVNDRMDFSISIDTAKMLSKGHAHNNRNAQIYVENNGYLEVFPETLRREPGIPVEGIPSRGDKRTRLVVTGVPVKAGHVLFPRSGAEELLMQLTGFGSERHDDLVDAFSIVVGEVVKRNRPRPNFDITFSGVMPITAGLRNKIF
ncbi:MAG: hypothetical protein WC763_01905 [Candidatus Paceibacterota bacterium]|jgi:predicted phage terminase large subunit-like protein